MVMDVKDYVIACVMIAQWNIFLKVNEWENLRCLNGLSMKYLYSKLRKWISHRLIYIPYT